MHPESKPAFPGAEPEGFTRWLGRAAVFFAVVMLLYLFLHSPFFAVQQIEVRGTSLLTPQEVIRLSGLSARDNVLLVDTQRVRRRILEDPRLGEVRVRRMPPGKMIIEVEERVPVALLPYADGFLFVDPEGRLIAADRRSRPGLPIITGVPLDRVGMHLPPPDGLLIAARVAHYLPPHLREQIAEIHVSPNQEVTLFTLSGIPVLYGEPTDLEQKGAILASLLQELGTGGVVSFDLRVPQAPAVRRR